MGKDPRDAEAYILEFVEKKDDTFEREIAGYNEQFCTWVAQMDSTYGRASSLVDLSKVEQTFQLKSRLLMSGYDFLSFE